MTPQELRYSVFKLAFSGKIVEQKCDEKILDKKAFDLDDAPFDIPNSWKWNLIGNVCEMYTGDSIAENVKKAKYEGLKEGFDYIGTKDVSFEHTISYNNGVRIPFENDFKRAYDGCILMCIEGGSAGRKIAILDREVCFGNKLCMFNASSVFNKFLYFYLQTSEFKSIFSGNLSGIIGGVSINKIKSILIPIPPFDEQKRIVSKIEELLPYVDRYENAWTKLEAFNNDFPIQIKKSILKYAMQGKLVKQKENENSQPLFEKITHKKNELITNRILKNEKPLQLISDDQLPFEIPDTWCWVRMSDVLDVRDGTHDSPKYYQTGIPFVTSKNICDGKIDFNDAKLISKEDADKINERSYVDDGDILFAMIGTIGNPVIVKKDREFCIKNVALIKNFAKDLLNTNFVYYYLLYIQDVLKTVAQASVQSFVSLSILRNYPMPLPPTEEQKRIVEKIEELLPLCRALSLNE